MRKTRTVPDEVREEVEEEIHPAERSTPRGGMMSTRLRPLGTRDGHSRLVVPNRIPQGSGMSRSRS